MKKISYLGPKGTYSWEAAMIFAERVREKYREEIELVELVSLEAVAKSVGFREVDMGVMAYYNYLEGLVQECLDLIYENNLRISGMQRLAIVLSIGAYKGDSDTKEIYSHPKALAQCSEFLWKNYRESKQIPITSTAAAAEMVKEKKSGLAIASSEALKRYGLEIIAEDIGNRKHGRTNFTDFYLVNKGNGLKYRLKYSEAGKYLTMVAMTPYSDKPGLLAEILQQVASYNLNNAKIHSRPALSSVEINSSEPQMFYLEIMEHQENNNMKRCIDSLKYKLTPEGRDIEVVRVLGSYERI